ncbi:MAG: hypothetical protein ACEY3K_09650 [Wolbachia sp.]
MALTAEQNTLCDRIYKSVRNRESIDEIIKEVKKEDFLTIFTATNDESKEKLLGTFEATFVGHLKAVLNHAKELGLLEEVVGQKILSSKKGDEVKSISLLECVTDPNCNQVEVLRTIDEIIGLPSFWKVISEDDRENIKSALKKEGNNDGNSQYVKMLEEIDNIKEDVEVGNKSSSRTSKAIVAGAICGVIAGLAVGGGLFAAGASLPILALIGIAVAAAIVTGLIIGVNTHATLSKPSNELNEADTHQQVPQTSKITA